MLSPYKACFVDCGCCILLCLFSFEHFIEFLFVFHRQLYLHAETKLLACTIVLYFTLTSYILLNTYLSRFNLRFS